VITISRTGALGDVILLTPLVNYMLNQCDDKILVATAYPAVFQNLSSRVETVTEIGEAYGRLTDFNGVYEKYPERHIVESYFDWMGFLNDDLDRRHFQQILHQAENLPDDIDWNRAVVVHPGRSWRNRTLPLKTWTFLISQLEIMGYQPVIVGTGRDWPIPEIKGTRDYTGQLTLAEVTGVIAEARCFIGCDSAMLHAAGSTDTPIVGVFTSVRPEYRLPYRQGKLGWNCKAVQPDLPCLGCLALEPVPATFCGCHRGDFACVEDVTAFMIYRAMEELLAEQVVSE
jgi:ADP-heptose:LPS heptosyltransferase